MKCEFTSWRDTKNLDVILVPETQAEIALLTVLAGLHPSPPILRMSGQKLEITFGPLGDRKGE